MRPDAFSYGYSRGVAWPANSPNAVLLWMAGRADIPGATGAS